MQGRVKILPGGIDFGETDLLEGALSCVCTISIPVLSESMEVSSAEFTAIIAMSKLSIVGSSCSINDSLA